MKVSLVYKYTTERHFKGFHSYNEISMYNTFYAMKSKRRK
jgi:hypothetical protein